MAHPRKIIIILAALISCSAASAQFSSTASRIRPVSSDPAGGACNAGDARTYNNSLYLCGPSGFASLGVVSGATLSTLAGKTIAGNGSDIRLSTGAFSTNDCVKVDANGNLTSAGAACGGGGGSGDVVGPASATDNAIARYDSTTGKLIQNSGVTIDDSNNITTPGTITSGSGASNAGGIGLKQGTANTAGANEIVIQAPTGVTAYQVTLPGATGTGFWLGTNSGGTETITRVASTGSDNVVRATSPTLVTPNLGTPSAIVLTNATGFPTLNQNTTGTAANLSGTPALPNGTTATTQSAADNSTKLATTAYADTAAAARTGTIASGAKALDTDAIASEACDTMTATATGAASTDVVTWTPNADITAVTGYAPETTGGLAIYVWPTTNTVNIKVCNPTSSSITPGAVTLNWRIVR